jgi:hypothetical protein
MFRLIVITLSLSVLGCGRQPPAITTPATDHASHDGHVPPNGQDAGMEGMSKPAAPATFVRDIGWDDLRPDVSTALEFHLERNGKTLKTFDLLHERPMHLIVVRDALDEFQHLHPQISDNGRTTVDINFPTAGNYWVFSDFQPQGEPQQTIRQEIQIEGDAPPAPELMINVPGRIAAAESQVQVSLTKSDEECLITFEHTSLAGEPLTDLEPYLGAMGHLVVIGADTGEYVHAHAESQSAPDGVVRFAAHFARPGIYKMWGQFQRLGTVFAIPAVLRIE